MILPHFSDRFYSVGRFPLKDETFFPCLSVKWFDPLNVKNMLLNIFVNNFSKKRFLFQNGLITKYVVNTTKASQKRDAPLN